MFHKIPLSIPVHRRISIIKVFPNFFCKTHLNLYMPASLFKWSWRLQVRIGYLWLAYPRVEISSGRSTLKKCKVFSIILVFIHFKLILESCTTSGVYLQPYQRSMMKLLAIAFLQKPSILDIWQGSKYGSAASFLNIVPLFLLWYLSKYINIFVFLLKVCS